MDAAGVQQGQLGYSNKDVRVGDLLVAIDEEDVRNKDTGKLTSFILAVM